MSMSPGGPSVTADSSSDQTNIGSIESWSADAYRAVWEFPDSSLMFARPPGRDSGGATSRVQADAVRRAMTDIMKAPFSLLIPESSDSAANATARRVIDLWVSVAATRTSVDPPDDEASQGEPPNGGDSSATEAFAEIAVPAVTTNDDDEAQAAFENWLTGNEAARRYPTRWLPKVRQLAPPLQTDLYEALGSVASRSREPESLFMAIVQGLNDERAPIRLGATLAMAAISRPEAVPFLEYSSTRESVPHIRGLQQRVLERLRSQGHAEGTSED